MLGGATGSSDRERGAVTASHAMRIISSASSPATTHPAICNRLFHGVGGAKALGGPAPKGRCASAVESAVGRGSIIGQAMLYCKGDTVKHVPQRDRIALTMIGHGRNGK
ncbi:hypothetical protein SCLO_1008510 [Sphingobium cloacae]|uniref:Uncharacterized protein n=1 Tax=Sphingobium cloacae TaxID=120107 RepID=A0A1E1F0B5_9SPHN|nr:hypothetical protein SCLO_1008510 [Sphingobium cloacae]